MHLSGETSGLAPYDPFIMTQRTNWFVSDGAIIPRRHMVRYGRVMMIRGSAQFGFGYFFFRLGIDIHK